jgi:hypothetical protein
MLKGPNGIFLPQNFGAFFEAVIQAESTQNWTRVQEMWGLTQSDVDRMTVYFLEVGFRWAPHTLQRLFDEGYGLFTNKTVHEW